MKKCCLLFGLLLIAIFAFKLTSPEITGEIEKPTSVEITKDSENTDLAIN